MKNTKLFCLPLSLLVSACATQPPVAEVRLVAKSFDQLNAASQPLLADLAIVECAQGKSSSTLTERAAQLAARSEAWWPSPANLRARLR